MEIRTTTLLNVLETEETQQQGAKVTKNNVIVVLQVILNVGYTLNCYNPTYKTMGSKLNIAPTDVKQQGYN